MTNSSIVRDVPFALSRNFLLLVEMKEARNLEKKKMHLTQKEKGGEHYLQLEFDA